MRENKDQFANIGVGMLVVGGVAALATGGYLAYALTAEDKATTATLKISPTGITLIGSF